MARGNLGAGMLPTQAAADGRLLPTQGAVLIFAPALNAILLPPN